MGMGVGMGILFYLGKTFSQRLLCKAHKKQQQNRDNAYMNMTKIRIMYSLIISYCLIISLLSIAVTYRCK